jgi:hypothetical protein
VVVLVGRIRVPFERFGTLFAVARDGSAEVLGKLAASGVNASVDGARE